MEDEVMKRYRAPSYFGELDLSAEDDFGGRRSVSASGENALCGDTLTLAFAVRSRVGEDSLVERARFTGYGCSLCLASADALMEMMEGRAVSDCLTLSEASLRNALGEPEIGRSRTKCLMLPLDIAKRALSRSDA